MIPQTAGAMKWWLVLCLASTTLVCGYVNEDKQATSLARDLHSTVPRLSGPDRFDANDDEYWRNLVYLATFGVCMSALTLIYFILWTLSSLCRGLYSIFFCIWWREEVGELPPRKESKLMVAFLSVFSIVTLIVCSIALDNNQNLSESLSGSSDNSMTVFIPSFLQEAQQRLDLVQPSVFALANFTDSNMDMLVKFNPLTSQFYQDGINPLANDVKVLRLDVNRTDVPCALCNLIQSTLLETAISIEHALPTVYELRNTTQRIYDKVISRSTAILDVVQKAQQQFRSVFDTFTELREGSGWTMEEIKHRDRQRVITTNALFSIPVFGFLVLLLAGVLKSKLLFHFMVYVSFIAMICMWLLFAVHLPLSVLLSDVCVTLDDEEVELFQSESIESQVLAACLSNVSLEVTFNYSRELEFSRTNLFPSTTVNASEAFAFQALHQLADNMSSATIGDMGYDYQAVLAGIVQDVNGVLSAANITSPRFSVTNISAFNLSDFAAPSPRDLLFHVASNLTTAAAQLNRTNQTLTSLRKSITHLSALARTIRDGAISSQVNSSLSEATMKPFINAARQFSESSHCGFLGETYLFIKKFGCSTVLNHIAVLSLCLFICAWVGIPLACLASRVGNRMPKDAQWDDELEARQYGQQGEDDDDGASAGVEELRIELDELPDEHPSPNEEADAAGSIGPNDFDDEAFNPSCHKPLRRPDRTSSMSRGDSNRASEDDDAEPGAVDGAGDGSADGDDSGSGASTSS